MRRKIDCSQKPPTALESAIMKLHSPLLRLRNTGNFKTSDLANMDQTPLPFVLDGGKSYDKKDMKEAWTQNGWTVRLRQETSDCPIDSIC